MAARELASSSSACAFAAACLSLQVIFPAAAAGALALGACSLPPEENMAIRSPSLPGLASLTGS